MLKIGLSTCGKKVNEELFAAYQKAGIGAMEYSVAPAEYSLLDYQQLKVWADRYGIALWSYHLPFSPFKELNIADPALAESTVAYFAGMIRKGADIGIGKFIIHPSGEPIADENRPAAMECAKESLYKMAEIARECGAVICVEDLPRTCLGNNSAEIAELISAHPDLKVCFDTNHLLGEDPAQFVRKLGKEIVTTHVSDYDFINERHWLPGEGKLDWASLLQAFKDVDYSGVWMYEISFDRPASLIYDRSLTCEDFVRNAEELFAGKALTVLAQAKPNLGMWV